MAGKVMDALTGLPMPGVYINIVSFRTTTDANGEFEFTELPPLNELMVFSDDDQLGVVGTHYDHRKPYRVAHLDYLQVYLMPDYQMDSAQYVDFYSFYVFMTTIGGTPFPNHQRRWEAPIDIYAHPFQNEGLDYQATIHQTALDLNPYIGIDVFNVLNDVPQVGVECIYPADLPLDNYGFTLWSSDWYPLQAEIEFRRVYTSASAPVFVIVSRHELGHALGLINHSRDTSHLMVGGMFPQVDNFTADELALIRVLYRIPRGTPISQYIRE